MVDYVAMASLRFLGAEGADAAPAKSELASRNMTEALRYLMDHPDSLRISGPNPAAGPNGSSIPGVRDRSSSRRAGSA